MYPRYSECLITLFERKKVNENACIKHYVFNILYNKVKKLFLDLEFIIFV